MTPRLRHALLLSAALAVAACGGQDQSSTALPDESSTTALTGSANPIVLYADALASGWVDWSWTTTRNFSNASPVASGSKYSIAATYSPWGGLYLHNAGVSTAGLTYLDLQIDGGATANPALLAIASVGGKQGPAVSIAQYCAGGTIPASAWTSCRVPLTALGAANATLDGIIVQEGAGKTLPTVYFDNIRLSPTVTSTWIYRDALVSPWADWSWAPHTLTNTTPIAAGTSSIAATFGAWQGLYFQNASFSLAGRSTVSVMVNGGATAGAALSIRAVVNGAWTNGTALGPSCAGGTIPANAWVRCDVPVTAIAPAGATITGVGITEAAGKSLPTMYFDEIGFDVPASTSTTPPATVTVAVAPQAATVATSASQAFTATCSGGSSAAVTWKVSESGGGTVTAAGVYTAPTTPGTYHVVATSQADTTKSATAIVTVPTAGTPPAVAVTVSPATASVAAGGSVTFSASVANSTNTGVTWTVQEGAAGGAVSSAGVYTAPTAAGTYHVVATSQADATKSASATVTVAAPAPAVAVAITPTSASLTTGGTQAFSATVSNTSNTAVTWKVSESGGGAVTSAGVYTAPATAGTYHVVATSQADASKSATATVTVAAPPPPSGGGTSSSIIPSTRTTPWNPGLNPVGGIPARTTICASVSPSGGDDTNAIQAALNACPANQVVQLAAGTYHLTQSGMGIQMRSNVTLRGAVDGNGRPTTRFSLAYAWNGPAFMFGEGGEDEGFLVQPVSLVSDGAKDATSVTLASNPGYVVGELVTIDQVVADPIWLNPDHFNQPYYTNNPSGTPGNRNMFCRSNRMIGQTLEITAVNGNTLTFSAPLHTSYPLANQPQIVRHSRYNGYVNVITAPVQYAGLENVYVEGGQYGGHVAFFGAKYSWAKNVESKSWLTADVSFMRSFRCVLRDSYIHQTQQPNPGGGGYAIDLCWHASDNLVENNIVWAANKVIVARSSGGGNVVGYNYFEDGFGAGYLTIPEAGANASHYAGPHMELFEGNQAWNLYGDNVWGNSLWITFFRNNATGLRRNVNGTPYWDSSGVLHANNNFQQDAGGRRMVGLGATHDYYNFVGNVLGYSGQPSPGAPWVYETTGTAVVAPAIWNIGFSQAGDVDATTAQADTTRARTLRHGNWDYGYTNGIVWDPTIANHTIPSSLYLSAAPSFFGSNTWPWVNPLTGSLYTLPARARFDAMLSAGTL